MAYGSWPASGGGQPYNKITSGKKGSSSRWRLMPALMVGAVVFYGGLVYICSFRDSTDGDHALTQQALSIRVEPDTKATMGGTWKPVAGDVDGVVVLGMHRSGTSMVTGLLQAMGLSLGEPGSLLRAKEGENDKGFFERLQVVLQNDGLMKEQDVNWALNLFKFDHLLALEHALTGKVAFTQGRAALAFFNDPANQPWAVKDPRLCLTLRFWLPFWRTPPAVLLVYRHPVEVARSLTRRKEFGVPRGLHLWIAYNRLAIQNSQGLCRVITSDTALIKDGAGALRMMYEQLRGCGVDVPRMATTEDIKSFIDPSLRHHTANHAEECQPTAPKLWKSDAASDHEKARENEAYAHAIRVYCAMEDGSAFSPHFEWEDLEDFAPP